MFCNVLRGLAFAERVCGARLQCLWRKQRQRERVVRAHRVAYARLLSRGVGKLIWFSVVRCSMVRCTRLNYNKPIVA